MPRRYRRFPRLVAILFLLLDSPAAHSSEVSLQDQIAELFRAQDVVGTLVVADAEGEPIFVHNQERAEKRFSPASTFKVLNTLIALDQGVVTSAESTFEWDGKVRGIGSWNQDQSLTTAFQRSCVWCYQEIARQVGIEHYQDQLAKLSFGNQQTGEVVDEFWLNSSLTISALEQIEFLRALAAQTLPFEPTYQHTLKSIMLNDEKGDIRVYAKTGWAIRVDKVGWFVGYLERDREHILFAMNMEMVSGEQASLRKSITLDALQILGLLD
ncbi:MAG: class D beta-lactamase [Pseudomonadota bacterium]